MFHIDFKFYVQAHMQFYVHCKNQIHLSVLMSCQLSEFHQGRAKRFFFQIPNLLNQLTHQPESHFLISNSISHPRRHNHEGFKTHFETAMFLGLNYRSNFPCNLLCFKRKAFQLDALNLPMFQKQAVVSTLPSTKNLLVYH